MDINNNIVKLNVLLSLGKQPRIIQKSEKGMCIYFILTRKLRRITAVMIEMQKAYMVPKKSP